MMDIKSTLWTHQKKNRNKQFTEIMPNWINQNKDILSFQMKRMEMKTILSSSEKQMLENQVMQSAVNSVASANAKLLKLEAAAVV